MHHAGPHSENHTAPNPMSDIIHTVQLALVSNKSHLDRFRRLCDRTSLLRAFIVGVDVPSGMPRSRSQGRYVPLVYFSAGILKVREGGITYVAERQPEPLGIRYYSVDNDFRVDLSWENIRSVGRYMLEPGTMGVPRINWIELDTTWFREPLLLCVGDSGILRQTRMKDTDNLYQLMCSALNRSK